MTENTRRLERLFYCLIFAIVVIAMPAHAADPSRTVISDVLYRADGSTAKGTILISWPAFTTSDGKPVAASTLSVKIGPNGSVNIPLIPTQGATPSGTAYRVVISLDDGSSNTEFWSVPTLSPTTIAAIRSTQVPTTVAMQVVSREYVDQQLAAALHKNGDESVSGAKTFTSSPVVPTPGTDAAAANKAYVDHAIAAAAPSPGNVLNINKGGTGASSFTPSRCVRVADDGNSLEAAAGDCGIGNSNADTLDGLHASAFLGATAKAADSDTVDGKHSSDLTNATQLQGTAVDTTAPQRGQQPWFDAAANKIKWRNADSVDVRDYGCSGDGVTDDSACLQSAFDAGAGKRIVLPKTRPSGSCDYFSSVTLFPKGNGTVIEGSASGNSNSATAAAGTVLCFPSGVTGIQIENSNCAACTIEHLSVLGGDEMGQLIGDPVKLIMPGALPQYTRNIATIQRTANVLTVTTSSEGSAEGLTAQPGSLLKVSGVVGDATLNGVCVVAATTASGGTATNPNGFTCAQNGADTVQFGAVGIVSLATTSPRNSDGIRICANFTTLRDVHVQNFARFGILADGTKNLTADHHGPYANCSSTAFADDYNLDHVSTWNNAWGVFAVGGDANAGTISNNSTFYYNWVWGLEEQSDVGGMIAGNQASYNGTASGHGTPATRTIASISRVASLVTLTFSSAPPNAFKAGHCTVIAGVTDASFNTPAGSCYFVSAVPSSSQIQYVQPGNPVDASSSGGTARMGTFAEVALSSGADFGHYKIGTSRLIYTGAFYGNYAEGGVCKYSRSSTFSSIAGPGTAGYQCATTGDWQGNWIAGAKSNSSVFWNKRPGSFDQSFATGQAANDGYPYNRFITDSTLNNFYWHENIDNTGGAGAPSGSYSLWRGYNSARRFVMFGPNLAGGATRVGSEGGSAVEINNDGGTGTGGLKICSGGSSPTCKLVIDGSGQVQSTVATGTAPMTVASTTAVANLNADMLDGSHVSDFANNVLRNINADRQTGADWCAKVNAADAALGSNPGQILLTSAAGNTTCSADVIINAGHTLREMEGATYRLNNYSLKYDSRSAIIGTGRPQAPTVKQTMFFYTGTGSAIAPKTPTALTLAPVLKDFGVADKNAWDGGTATALAGIDLTNVGYCTVSNIAAYQFAKTGAAAFLRYTMGTLAGAYYCRFENVYGTYNYDGMVWDNDAAAKTNFENYGTGPLRDTVINSQFDISSHYAYDVRDQSSGSGGQTTLTFVSPKAESYGVVGMHLAARANTIDGAKIEDHHNAGQIALLLDGHGCDNYVTGSYWADPIGNPSTKVVDNNSCPGGAGGDTPGNTVETGSGFGGLKISGGYGLPRTTNWHLWLGSDDDSSRLGRIYIGDGSGTKRLEFAARANSVDTPVMGVKDSSELFLYRPTTYTDETHFEKARLYWNGNIFQIGTDAGSGSGVYRSLCLAPGNSQTLCTNSSTIFFNRDNVVDIGTAGFKPRTIYAGTSVDAPKLTGITDTAAVTNLNADMLDGKHASDFAAAGSYRVPIRGYCTGIAGSGEVISVEGIGATTITCDQPTPPGPAGALMTATGTLKNLYINEGTTHKSGTSMMWTVFKNNVATDLTCTVASGATTCSDTSHSFTVAAGDYLTVKSSTTASTGETLANVSVAMEVWN